MAWVIDRLGRSLFRGTGITAHMENGGTLEKVRQMVARVSTRATQLYDRRQDRVTLDEVEEIAQSAHTSRRSNRSHSANRRARGYRIRNDSADSRKFRTGSQFEVSGSGKLMRTIMADLASPSSSATSFGTASSQVWLRPRARRVVLEPESEVRMINQHSTYVRRFSITPIIASLANPTAIMARAS
jgi:hypothetical protein